jgi:hypothetical protein
MRQFPAAVLMSCVLLPSDRPAIAQSSTALDSARVSLTSVHSYVAADATPGSLAAPDNLVVSPMYFPIVDAMLRGSPTFRRQCMRIAAEPSLIVHLTIGPRSPRHGVRATTRLTRNAKRQLVAAVHIAPLDEVEELIAHEFEHIIEQLDGIDLAKHASLRNTGVSSIGGPGSFGPSELFETIRAQRVGHKVASELGR